MQLQCVANFVKNFGRNNKPRQTISEFVTIVRLKRFVKRRRSGSAEDDDSRASQESNEMSTSGTLADSNKAISLLLNSEAQPWFPHSSRRQLLRPTKRLICEL